MPGTDVVARSLNEMSLAAWFGGSLMGAVGLERAAAEARDRRVEVESAGWSAWQPLQVAAVAAQLGSTLVLTVANRKRLAGQHGVGTTSAIRAAATAAALGATMLAARTGSEVARAAHDGEPAEEDRLEKRIRTLQWAVPALTGAMVVLDAVMGEQQRPTKVAKGATRRLVPDGVRELGKSVLEVPDRLLDKVA